MATTKLDRKELKKPDEFQLQAGKAVNWMVSHQRQLVIALALFVVVVLAAWGASAYVGKREAQAGSALSEALELSQRPVAGEPAQPGAETFASKEERSKALLAALEKVHTDYPSSLAARTAQAQLGFEKLKSGDAAGAQAALQDFVDHAGNDHPLRTFAIESLGYAQEAQGKLDDAAATFARLKDAGAPERAQFQAARLALVQGKPDARQQLEDVAKNNAKDPVSMEANLRLELASMPPVAPGSVPDAPKATEPGKAEQKPAPGKAAQKPAPATKQKPVARPAAAPKKK